MVDSSSCLQNHDFQRPQHRCVPRSGMLLKGAIHLNKIIDAIINRSPVSPKSSALEFYHTYSTRIVEEHHAGTSHNRTLCDLSPKSTQGWS